MKKILFAVLIILFSFNASAFAWFWEEPAVPGAADSIGKQMDKQLSQLVKNNGLNKSDITIAVTVPVLLNDFNQTSQLGRQMSEEVARYLSQKGYQVLEIRKGTNIEMSENKGEFLLTRNTKKLFDDEVSSIAVLTGTYVFTSDNIRFTMRLLNTSTNEVLAMGSGTVPVSGEVAELLNEHKKAEGLRPVVQTKLSRR